MYVFPELLDFQVSLTTAFIKTIRPIICLSGVNSGTCYILSVHFLGWKLVLDYTFPEELSGLKAMSNCREYDHQLECD